VLAAAGTVAAIAVILLVGGGEDNETRSGTVATNPSTQTTPTQSQTNPQLVAQVNLTPPGGGRSPAGIALIARVGGQNKVQLQAAGVSPGAYAVWLYNSAADARLLGFVPRPVGRSRRFNIAGDLPGDAGRYRFVVVSRVPPNTRTTPSRPGPIVLQGRLNLG
jgi:hypothetical protein